MLLFTHIFSSPNHIDPFLSSLKDLARNLVRSWNILPLHPIMNLIKWLLTVQNELLQHWLPLLVSPINNERCTGTALGEAWTGHSFLGVSPVCLCVFLGLWRWAFDGFMALETSLSGEDIICSDLPSQVFVSPFLCECDVICYQEN